MLSIECRRGGGIRLGMLPHVLSDWTVMRYNDRSIVDPIIPDGRAFSYRTVKLFRKTQAALRELAALCRKTLLSPTLVLTRDAKKSPKTKPEPRPAPHEIFWAQHRALQASFKHHTKPGSQCIMHCDCLPRARHEPGALSPGSAKSPAEPEFWARPVRRA